MNQGAHAPILTGADRLLELVKDAQKISLSDAAHILDTSSSIVERWVEVLEEQDKIVVRRGLRKSFLLTKEYHDTHSDFKETISLAVSSAKGGYVPPKDDSLREQQKQLALKAKQVKRHKELLSQKEQALIEKTSELAGIRKKLALREKEVKEQKEAFVAKERALETFENSLEKARAALQKEKKLVNRLNTTIVKQKKEIALEKGQLVASIAKQQKAQNALKEKNTLLIKAQKELATTKDAVAIQSKEIISAHATTKAVENELKALKQELSIQNKRHAQELSQVKKECLLLAEALSIHKDQAYQFKSEIRSLKEKLSAYREDTKLSKQNKPWARKVIHQIWQ